MTKPSLKTLSNQRRIIAHQGRKNAPSLKTVRECLQYGGITTGMWATELRVVERRVQKWRSGEEPVPEERRLEILIKFQNMIHEQLIAINQMVSRALREAYGIGVDPGSY